MKNYKLLADHIDSATSTAILTTEAKHRQHLKIRCDILGYDVDKKAVTVRVEQFEKPTDTVFTVQELIEKAKEVFSHLPQGIKVHYRALTWKGQGLDAISAEWVKNQMQKRGLYQSDLVDLLGVDKVAISRLLSGGYEFTRWHKAAFYYLFKSL